MAQSSAARKPALVHPASESRIERASLELAGLPVEDKPAQAVQILTRLGSAIQEFGLRSILSALEERKTELSARLLVMVKREGEADELGKVRYETDLHKFVVIPGKNVTISEKKLRQSMVSIGLTPKQIDKAIKPARSEVEYEYVGVYGRKDEKGE